MKGIYVRSLTEKVMSSHEGLVLLLRAVSRLEGDQ